MRDTLIRAVEVSAFLGVLLTLTACGGGGSNATGSGGTGVTYTLSGQVQKGPFAIGSQISVNELDASLNPTGKVYNVQTSDDLGDFAVSSKIGTNLVEIIGDGFYMDELTGQLAASQIQLRAVSDLSINATPTVNVLTALQEPRLKTLLAQGAAYVAANNQSQTEVLATFGIDATKVNSLSTLFSMQINGSGDADAVLLATSVILSKMANNAAVANTTTQPAELSNYINTIAAQIAATGTITNPAIISARNLAATQVDLAAVRTNLETYYAKRGVSMVAPKFEEWVDKSGSGVLPQRLVPVAGLAFTDVTSAVPGQLITSNPITVAGLGAGMVAPVAVDSNTTIIKNNVAVPELISTLKDGDTIALRVVALGYGCINASSISVGSSSAVWHVTSQLLSGTISGFSGVGLVLQNNAIDSIAVPSGSTSFSFSASMPIGSNYSITVLTQPNSPLQACSVSNGSGTVGVATSNITVVCAAAAGLALVATGNGISSYSIDAATGALAPVVSNPIAAGTGPTFIAVAPPSGKFAYVANGGSNNISAFAINSATGALTPVVGSPISAGTHPNFIAIDPSGKFAYVSNYSSNNVSAYTIDATTGALTQIAGSPLAGVAAGSIAMDPSGRFAYSANTGSNSISAYAINPASGALTPLAGSPFASGLVTGWISGSIAIDTSGKFAYAWNWSGVNAQLSAYTIDAVSGALAPIAGSPFYSGMYSVAPAVSPNGKFLYIPDPVGSVSALAIDAATGALTAVAGSPFQTMISPYFSSIHPNTIAFDPSGKFAYAGSPLLAMNIDPVTGVVAPIAGIPFLATMSPTAIAIAPIH